MLTIAGAEVEVIPGDDLQVGHITLSGVVLTIKKLTADVQELDSGIVVGTGAGETFAIFRHTPVMVFGRVDKIELVNLVDAYVKAGGRH